DREPIGDEIDYHGLATHVSDGSGYRTATGQATARRPPLYPLFLAGLYKVTGAEIFWGRLVQVLLGVVVVWLSFVVCRKYFDARAAWVTGSLCALNPFLIFISGYVLTENLYMVVILVTLYLGPKPTSLEGSWRLVVSVGLLIGLWALARPSGFAAGVWILFSYMVLGGGDLRRRVQRGVVFFALILLPLVPWAARNKAAMGEWIFFTTHGGSTFYQGNNTKVVEIPQYRGGVAPLYMLPGKDEIAVMNEVERDRASWALGKQFLSENKRHIPKLLWWKFQRFWRFKSDQGMSGVRSGWWFDKNSGLGRLAAAFDVGLLYAALVIPLFVAGLFLTRRRWRDLVFLYGVLLIHALVPLVFHGSLRMRIPIEPIMAMFAAAVILRIYDRIGRPLQNSGRIQSET
ncbi:MAG: glycosyltransferase family 39 protein, partial [bacterium]|nr:glycosyltransferase family 39 protein [bacterium]